VIRQLLVRLRALFGRGAAERELNDELAYHLERDTARREALGESPREARAAALRAFGNVTLHQEQMRDAWGWPWIAQLRQDVGYTLRGMRRTPAFALTVIGTIALALGLNTTAFTIFNTYVLRPIAVRDPGALYELTLQTPTGAIATRFSWASFVDLREQPTPFSEVFAYRVVIGRMQGSAAAGQAVSGNYFQVLGLRPMLGRGIVPDDDLAPGTGPVMVLGYDTWRARFGADSGIIGRRVLVDGQRLEVIGVMPPTFNGETVAVDFWTPLSELGLLQPSTDVLGPTASGWVGIVGRLQPRVTPERAGEMLTRWSRAHTRDSTSRVALWSKATMVPLNAEVLAVLTPIIAAFVLVLLIACANVANMMLARGMARQREIGIRLSLGAGRGRLVRQLLTESIVLSIPAALLGFALSRLTINRGVGAMFASLPPEFAALIHVLPLTPDLRVFTFMLVAAMLSAVFFGLAPAVQTTRPSVVQATRGDLDTPKRSSALRNGLVIAQITVCALLLIVAGLFLRGARGLEQLNTGVRAQGVVELMVSDLARARVLEQLRRLPEIQTLAAAATAPFDGIFTRAMFATSLEAGARQVMGGYNQVTPSYFGTLDITVVRGRAFSENEARSGAPVVVVSEGAAAALWPGKDPLGATLFAPLDRAGVRPGPLSRFREATVIGVARNTVPGYVGMPLTWPVLYYPLSLEAGGTSILVRVHGDAERGRAALDAHLTATDSGAVKQIHTLEDARAVQLYPFRAAYWVSSVLGSIALLLTVTGVYGVLAYVVQQRTREIGVRMALGATAVGVVGLVLRQLSSLAAVGIALGGTLALGVSFLAAAFVPDFDAFDPLGYAMGAVAVLLACLAAAIVPSRRAATVQPVTALRHD
jgi:predicted permease